MTNENELPREDERIWVDGKLPITQDEWDKKPTDYKINYSEVLKAPALMYWDRKTGTCLAPVVIVERSRIERIRIEAKQIKQELKTNLPELAKKLQGNVRTVSFNERHDDPYIICHADSRQLTDEVLRARFADYLNTFSGGEADAETEPQEDFEAFLDFLELKFGYFSLIVSDKMISFQEPIN